MKKPRLHISDPPLTLVLESQIGWQKPSIGVDELDLRASCSHASLSWPDDDKDDDEKRSEDMAIPSSPEEGISGTQMAGLVAG